MKRSGLWKSTLQGDLELRWVFIGLGNSNQLLVADAEGIANHERAKRRFASVAWCAGEEETRRMETEEKRHH